MNYIEGQALKDIYTQFIYNKNKSEFDIVMLPFKILHKISEYLENGFYFSKNFFVRKEIW
jgi:hypothetical protein